MPGVGIINRSPGIFRAGAGLPFPIDGLQHRYDPLITYDSEGTTYMRDLLGDDDVPKISGTGLDTIYDFSGLNDIRLNKNAYVGNSFSLPEYYNYPYVDIYFDTSNPYHWKLKDFHYANLDKQTDIAPRLIQDEFFLKAKATTNTSNVITSVSELFIYSAALSGNNLQKVKTYIGIQPDFYELYDTPNLFIDDSWTTSDAIINSNVSFTTTAISGLIVKSLFWGSDYKIGDIFRFHVKRNLHVGTLRIRSSTNIYNAINLNHEDFVEFSIISYSAGANQVIQLNDNIDTITFDNFYVEKKYINYYAQ